MKEEFGIKQCLETLVKIRKLMKKLWIRRYRVPYLIKFALLIQILNSIEHV